MVSKEFFSIAVLARERGGGGKREREKEIYFILLGSRLGELLELRFEII